MTEDNKKTNFENTDSIEYIDREVFGKVIKISDTKNDKLKKLTLVTTNDTYFSVFIPIAIEIHKFSSIKVRGSYTQNVTEKAIYQSIFPNANNKNHFIKVLVETDNLLETA